MDVTIPCPCPTKGTGEPRHESDNVTLRDRLDFARQGLSAVGSSPGAERDALLRVVCSAAAQCNQRELRLALSFEAPLPI